MGQLHWYDGSFLWITVLWGGSGLFLHPFVINIHLTKYLLSPLLAIHWCHDIFSFNSRSSGSLLDCADAFVFHSPFCKLVCKSVGRLLLNDFLQDPDPDFTGRYSGLESFKGIKLENTYFNKDLETAFMTASKDIFEKKTKPSIYIANQVGNMYTPSVFGGTPRLGNAQDLAGKRVVLFSYGSGLASSMYSLRISDDLSPTSPLHKLLNNLSDVKTRLESRRKVPPKEFDRIMKLREETHNIAPYCPVGSVDILYPGTWYLAGVDSMHRRKYERKLHKESNEENLDPVVQNDTSKVSQSKQSFETFQEPKVHYRMYSKAAMAAAMKKFKETGCSIRKAAKEYGIPEASLRHRLSGRVNPEATRSGPPPLFSAVEETRLADHLKLAASFGYGYGRTEIIKFATEYAIEVGHRDQDHPLTPQWYASFMSRRPDLQIILKARSLNTQLLRATSIECVSAYYIELKKILNSYSLTDKIERIYIVNEKLVSTIDNTPIDLPSDESNSNDNPLVSWSNFTVIGCGNAQGCHIPPFFVFTGERMSKELRECKKHGVDVDTTDSGESNIVIMKRYMARHLIKYLPVRTPDNPVLLLYDGHNSSISLGLMEWAKTEHIVMFMLPSYASHVFQQVNAGIFGGFEKIYDNECRKYIRKHNTALTKQNICAFASKAYSKALSTENLKGAFKKLGICPLNLGNLVARGNLNLSNRKHLQILNQEDVKIEAVEEDAVAVEDNAEAVEENAAATEENLEAAEENVVAVGEADIEVEEAVIEAVEEGLVNENDITLVIDTSEPQPFFPVTGTTGIIVNVNPAKKCRYTSAIRSGKLSLEADIEHKNKSTRKRKRSKMTGLTK
ncbi:hypothetical protein ACJMK2_040792 [Sinanodonta woodiana]|uniref:Hydroxymethylglutaryl-CoA synthase n=1 Tax=Sinanodonta woodiana TaxID=1069815 RepID=A0ABD3W250_SINWO